MIGDCEEDITINTLSIANSISVLVLDEIDQLNKDLLYQFFDWTSKSNSRLILIGN
jgi:Cdc6-like AAA superfamily ATPase